METNVAIRTTARTTFPVFLKNDPAAKVFVGRMDDEDYCFCDDNGVLMVVTVDTPCDVLLQFIASKRRYNLRRDPTIDDLRVTYPVEGEQKPIPWTEFVMIEATNDLNLSEIHECFACCTTFANVQPANRLKLGDVALIESPCGNPDHHVCVDCFRSILLNFYSHPITKSSPTMCCFFPDCGYKSKVYKDAEALFTPDEWQQLQAHITKVTTPEMLRCNCHNCHNMISMPMGPQHKNGANVNIGCVECDTKTCWHCNCASQQCQCSNLNSRSGKFNRHFRPLLRNYEIGIDLCRQNFDRVLANPTEPMGMPCPKCGAFVEKSVACNQMSHCGVKWCYLCGMQTLPTEDALVDHFGRHCPLYESRDCQCYWQKRGARDYYCREHICYDDWQSCTTPSHALGRKQKHVLHRVKWMLVMLRNLPDEDYQSKLIDYLLRRHGSNPVVRWGLRNDVFCLRAL